MDNKGTPKKKRLVVYDKIRAAGSLFTRHFERSATAFASALIRRTFLKLSTRAVGIFLLTLGVYAFLIALLLLLFTERSIPLSSLFGSGTLALCSIPLLFSKGNVSTALTNSAAGEMICDHLNIRRETLFETQVTGHPGIAFVAGVGVSALTLLFPLGNILFAVSIAIIFAMILSVPEAGLTFSVVFLFITDIKMQYALIGVTAFSYIFKLIRKKRKLSLRRTDIIFSIFLLCTLGAVVFCSDGSVQNDSIRFAYLLVPYYLSVYLLRDCRRITKLLCAAVLTAGALSAVYILGFSANALAPLVGAADKSYLLDLVKGFPVFESRLFAIAFSALIPVATAFIIKPQNEGYRFTLILCLVSVIACLVINEELACLLAASVITVLLLLATGSRRIYLTLSAVLTSFVLLTFAGSFGDRLYKYVYTNIYEAYNQAESLNALSKSPVMSDYIISGHGFSDSVADTSNFFYSLLFKTGIVGAVILSVFLIFIFCQSVLVIARTYRASSLSEGVGYLSHSENRECTRMGMIAAISSLAVTLIICTFTDFYKNDLLYMILFLMCGVCAAYARSANLEFLKTSRSAEPQATKESAFAVIKASPARRESEYES